MSFIRTKTINGNEYAYRVKSVRTDDGVRQEVLEYLRRADKIDSDSDGLVDASDCDPDDPTEKGEKHRMVEKETENRVKDIFSRGKEKLEVDPELELEIIKHRPIVDENVYGEAYPDENKIKLDVHPEASEKELKRAIIDELMHIKNPDFEQYDEESHEREEFREKIREYSKEI